MPIGYLFTIGLLGVCTAAALIPPPGYGRAGRISHFLAVVISEVPHFGALWLILSTALALSEGGLDGPVGTVLLALSAIILLGLLVVLRRCLLARSVVTALIRAHTEPRRGNTSSAPPPRWTWLRPLLFPVPLRPRSVMRIGGLSYGEHRRQRLDVYRLRNQTLSGPVLVYFHGGGYSSGGNRREARALLHHLATRGGSASARRTGCARKRTSPITSTMHEPCCAGHATTGCSTAETPRRSSWPAARPEHI